MNNPEYCRHYNIPDNWRNTKCDAGIEYIKVRSREKEHAGNNSPCYNPAIRHLCPHWQAPLPLTDEQIKEREEADRLAGEFIDNFAKMLEGKADKCLRCGQPIDKLEQVGRSVYARPCNCRQYQGKVPNKEENPDA